MNELYEKSLHKLELDKVLALITTEGGPTSHTAILAREKSIVAVVGVAEAASLHDGDMVIVDAAADVIITDPPRAGMHQDVVDVILFAEPKRIVYVSCNPATQARDLQLLDVKYRVKAVQPVDMFPHTHHVENVVLLELK